MASRGIRPPPVRLVRGVLIALVTLAIAAYLALHSPLRGAIAQFLGTPSGTCYFACSPVVTVQRVLEVASGLLLLSVSGIAARAMTRGISGIAGDRVLALGLVWMALVTVSASYVAGLGQVVGVPLLRAPVGPLLATLPSVVALVIVTFAGRRGTRRNDRVGPATPLIAWLAAVVTILLSAALTVRLTHPTSSYDALSYHVPLSLFLWRGGDLGSFLSLDPEYWSLAQPGLAELWSGLLQVIGGDTVAGLSQLPFALLGAVAVAVLAGRTGLPVRATLLAAAAYLIVPLLVLQLGTRLNDVIAAGMFLAVAGLLSAPHLQWSSGRIAVAAVGIGLVTATKLALLPGTAALGVVLIAGVVLKGRTATPSRSGWRRALVLLAAAGSIVLIVVLPWWARNIAIYGNPVYPADLPLFGGGFDQTLLGTKDTEFVPFPLAWLLYPLIEPHNEYSGFGLMFGVGVIGAVAFLRAPRHRSVLLIAGLVWALTIPAWWMLTRHEPRFLLGPAGLVLAFTPWILVAIGGRRRRFAYAGFGAAAAASALITLTSAIAPLADEPTEPVAFYDTVWSVLPAAMTLPPSDGIAWEYGCADDTYPAFLPLVSPPSSDGATRLVVPISCRTSPAEIADLMRQSGLRYAYVMVGPESRDKTIMAHSLAGFEVVASAVISGGRLEGTTRYLYRLRDVP